MAVLDKHFDHVLIGKNYLSCMMAIGLLKRQKKVLLIDDERMKYGENFLSLICAWEKDFIATYAQDESIFTLSKIEEYTTALVQTYQIENRLLTMGASPFLNLIEIMRKFPEFLPLDQLPEWQQFMKNQNAQDEFDELFHTTIRRLAANSARFAGLERQPVEVYLNQCPELLQKVIRLFIERLTHLPNLQDEQGDLAKTFLYLMQALFHFQMKISCAPMELFHLFLSLLSVQYRCDLERLTEDLLAELKACGGQFKKTAVREWKFHKLRPWSIELASFDGIVHPQHVSFFGGLPEKMALKCSSHFQGHRALVIQRSDVNKEQNQQHYLRLRNHRTYIGKKEWIGTNFPWCAHEKTSNGHLFILPTPYQKGFKTSFVVHPLHQFLEKQTKALLGGVPTSPLWEEKMDLSADIWMEGPVAAKTTHLRGSDPGKKLAWYDGSTPASREKLKNINYFGPLNSHGLGLISSLSDIKDYQHYQ